MNPYFLFFDFDNTVYVNSKISDATFSAMEQAQKDGHRLILCTGRSEGHRAILPQMFDIPWDGMIFGGSDIYYNGTSYEKHTIGRPELEKWMKYAREHGYDLILEGQKELTTLRYGYADQISGKAIFGYHDADFEDQKEKKALPHPDLDTVMVQNPVTKITIMKGNPDSSDFPKTDMPYIIHPHYMEAFAPGCDKGIAIRRFCKHIGISLEQCVCFGDSMNDYSMFTVCPKSIAVKWAPKALSDAASYTAKTDEGVAEGIAWLLNRK